MRESFTQNATAQEKEALNKVIKFLNISEDEYWNNYSVKAYRDMMSMENLKAKIKAEATNGIREQTEQKKAYDNALNKLVDELKVKYNVEIKAKY